MSKVGREYLEELIRQFDACDWPADVSFDVHDDPDPHKPCYLVMPGGASLAFNHHDGEGVDKARAEWITEACNQRLRRETERDAALLRASPPQDK